MQARPRVLILDFGGVISKTLFETHELTESALGLPAGTLTWQGPFDPAGDPLWTSMQAGEISERDYWLKRSREVGKLLGQEWDSMVDFVSRARGADVTEILRPEMQEVIRSCKQEGIELAILSNELDLFYGKDFRHRLPFLADFRTICDATYTGILKPDPRAFELCLEALGREPADCLFVDDQARNIAGARAVGLHTCHFDVTKAAQSCGEIMTLLGLPAKRPIA